MERGWILHHRKWGHYLVTLIPSNHKAALKQVRASPSGTLVSSPYAQTTTSEYTMQQRHLQWTVLPPHGTCRHWLQWHPHTATAPCQIRPPNYFNLSVFPKINYIKAYKATNFENSNSHRSLCQVEKTLVRHGWRFPTANREIFYCAVSKGLSYQSQHRESHSRCLVCQLE